MTAEQNKIVVTHLMEKINGNADQIIRLDGSDRRRRCCGVLWHHSRITVRPFRMRAKEGIKVGSLRMIPSGRSQKRIHIPPSKGRSARDHMVRWCLKWNATPVAVAR